MSIFNEETLENAVIELFAAEGYPHVHGETIHKEMADVLLRDDLRQYLYNRYSAEDITKNEVESILRQLDSVPSAMLYESNKKILNLIANGFTLTRKDRTQKDFQVHLIDFETLENNTIAAMIASMWLLAQAARDLPIGTANAVWTGIGAVGAALLGVILFQESANLVRLGCIALIVLGIVGLKLSTPS